MEHAGAGLDACPAPTRSTRRCAQFAQAFDPRHGGFGDAPKFPRPSELLFLLREHARTGDADARDMVLRTLRAMALGGMRDHIGGGFHRYSVDAAWRVPHFEKMLYDQAQLVLASSKRRRCPAIRSTPRSPRTRCSTCMREMTDAGGGFYSAEDADSIPPEQAGDAGAHKTEGAFYLWSADELDALLGDDAAVVEAAVRHRAGRQRADRIRSRSSPARTCSTSRGRSTTSRKQTGEPTEEVVEVLERARGCACSRRGSTGRGRTSTTRC